MGVRFKITKIVCYLFLVVATSAIYGTVNAQSIKSLEADIVKLRNSIERAEKLLSEKGSEEKANLQQISLLRSQIESRKSIVSKLKSQSSIISKQINTNKSNITKLEGEQADLRDEYSDMMVLAYKNYLFSNTLLFLFSATDFNDLQMRIYYIKKYSNMRFELSQQLDIKANQISIETDSLSSKRSQLDKITQSTQSEVNALNRENNNYNRALANIRKDKNSLSAQIKKSQSDIRKMQDNIKKIVAEEARKEAERLRKASEAKRNLHVAESKEFAKFKSKLPAPTDKGVIVERFGKHPHPVQKNLVVENKGLNYQVSRNSQVKAVFNGVVTKVFFFQGLNNSVMIRHGEYYTTYSGLTKVDVEVGDEVKIGEVLGTINSSTQILHFELWKGTTNLNPELWLTK